MGKHEDDDLLLLGYSNRTLILKRGGGPVSYTDVPYRLWLSTRGIPLVYIGPTPKDRPILTVENYLKWYNLFAVFPDGRVKEVTFGDIEIEGEPSLCDHCFNPLAVHATARQMGYEMDLQSFDMIVGRWEIEAKNRYDLD